MNDIDSINPCALSDSDFAGVSPRIKTAFNIVGIMFFITIIGYLAFHCI